MVALRSTFSASWRPWAASNGVADPQHSSTASPRDRFPVDGKPNPPQQSFVSLSLVVMQWALKNNRHGYHGDQNGITKENYKMRSDLIFGALTHVTNRYQLCQLASKATRKLHKPNTRLQDTTNEVLDRFKDTVPMDDAPEAKVEKIHVEARQERRAA